uniref:protein O-GlcNAcase n=1 Tax=Panagrellus redivivus TaxID=6233 RepID=A0A7E4W056_PANRE
MPKHEGSLWGVVEGFYGRPWTTEQRHDLFKRLQENGLNSYLYAPKDDEKHRASWRDLYNESECCLLRSLIESATQHDVTFIYALSPGVDIIYSKAEEVDKVKAKLRQVRSLGCRAFALLFDDILAEMRHEDREVFPSFAHAQVALSNECFADLGEPTFSFCPTEYRGGPGIVESPYLRTVGNNLHPDIDIMWTGPTVVSRTITIEHLEMVASVMKRRPLIWDNYHANDYDPKRVFLGPLMGRSVDIKKYISGLLLNPNCQYEANFLPMHTLGEWYRADCDFPGDDQVNCIDRSKVYYDPVQSVTRGISKWIHVYNGGTGPSIPPISSVESQISTPVVDGTHPVSSAVPPFSIRTCEGNDLLPLSAMEQPPPVYTSPIGTATTITVQSYPIDNSIMNPIEAQSLPQIVNSLTVEYSDPAELNGANEEPSPSDESPMDTSVPIEGKRRYSSLTDFVPRANGTVNFFDDKKAITMLVDFHYLPFNFGQTGLRILRDFQWLQEHANIVSKSMPYSEGSEEVKQWRQRADWIRSIIHPFTQFYIDLLDAPNRSLVQEIFPYIWDTHAILTVLKALIEWMQEGNLIVIPREQGEWWDPGNFAFQEEPWAFGGGLNFNFQKLVVKTAEVADFFNPKNQVHPTASCFTVNTITLDEIDRQELYNNFTDASEKAMCSNAKDFYNEFVAMFEPYFTPQNHFVAKELIPGQCAHTCALFFTIPDIGSVLKNDLDFRQRLSSTLPTANGLDDVQRFAIPFEKLPDDFLVAFPSYVDLHWRAEYENLPVAQRRLLQCGAAALSLNGSCGCFAVIPNSVENKINVFIRLGFDRCMALDIPGFTVLIHAL